MKKVFLSVFALMMFALPVFAQTTPERETLVSLFAWRDQANQRLKALEAQNNAQQSAAINALIAQLQQQQAANNQLLAMVMLNMQNMQRQQSAPAPQAAPQQPMILLLPNPNGGIQLNPNPGPPIKLNPNPGPPIQINPNPGPAIPINPNPGPSIPINPNPGGGIQLNPNPSPNPAPQPPAPVPNAPLPSPFQPLPQVQPAPQPPAPGPIQLNPNPGPPVGFQRLTIASVYRVSNENGELVLDIAEKAYGNRAMWSAICRANPNIQAHFRVPCGTDVVIPVVNTKSGVQFRIAPK